MADASMKEGYAQSYGSKSGGAHGPGGLKAAKRNPNAHAALNGAPDGPYSHMMGYHGDAGYHGDTSCEHRGGTFHFK